MDIHFDDKRNDKVNITEIQVNIFDILLDKRTLVYTCTYVTISKCLITYKLLKNINIFVKKVTPM